MVELAQHWTSAHLPVWGKRMDLAPYVTPALGEDVPAPQQQAEAGALHGEVSNMHKQSAPRGVGKVAGAGKETSAQRDIGKSQKLAPHRQHMRDVPEGTLTLGWPSRRTLCKTWQNFQLRMALLGRGSPMA